MIDGFRICWLSWCGRFFIYSMNLALGDDVIPYGDNCLTTVDDEHMEMNT
jgi:hypothetical protein